MRKRIAGCLILWIVLGAGPSLSRAAPYAGFVAEHPLAEPDEDAPLDGVADGPGETGFAPDGPDMGASALGKPGGEEDPPAGQAGAEFPLAGQAEGGFPLTEQAGAGSPPAEPAAGGFPPAERGFPLAEPGTGVSSFGGPDGGGPDGGDLSGDGPDGGDPTGRILGLDARDIRPYRRNE